MFSGSQLDNVRKQEGRKKKSSRTIVWLLPCNRLLFIARLSCSTLESIRLIFREMLHLH